MHKVKITFCVLFLALLISASCWFFLRENQGSEDCFSSIYAPTEIVIAPNGKGGVVIDHRSERITAFSTLKSDITGIVDVKGNVKKICYSPDSSRIYVLVNDEENEILTVDAVTLKVLGKVKSENMAYQGLVVSPDGKNIYASSSQPRRLVKLNAVTGEITTSVETNYYTEELGISPDGLELYVPKSSELIVLDATTLTKKKSFSIKGYISGMAMSPNGKKIALPFGDGGVGIYIFSPEIAEISQILSMNPISEEMNFSENSDTLFAADFAEPRGVYRKISVFDIASRNLSHELNIKDFQGAIGRSPNTGRIYVILSSNVTSNELAEIDSVSGKIMQKIEIPTKEFNCGQKSKERKGIL